MTSLVYVTVRENNFETFDHSVSAKLAEGYELYGQPYTVGASRTDLFRVCQAMTKALSQSPVMVSDAELKPKAEAKAANKLPRSEQLNRFEQHLEAHDGGNQPA
jgi:hypothetical protein